MDFRGPSKPSYLPHAIQQPRSSSTDGKLWLMGGCHDANVTYASVLIYDEPSDTWTTGPALPRGMPDCCAAAVDGEIFITSDRIVEGNGEDSDDSSSEVTWVKWCFAYRNGAWVQVAVPGGPAVQNPEHQIPYQRHGASRSS